MSFVLRLLSHILCLMSFVFCKKPKLPHQKSSLRAALAAKQSFNLQWPQWISSFWDWPAEKLFSFSIIKDWSPIFKYERNPIFSISFLVITKPSQLLFVTSPVFIDFNKQFDMNLFFEKLF